jgi:hypothetical protein
MHAQLLLHTNTLPTLPGLCLPQRGVKQQLGHQQRTPSAAVLHVPTIRLPERHAPARNPLQQNTSRKSTGPQFFTYWKERVAGSSQRVIMS